MEEIAAYGLGSAPVDVEYAEVKTKPEEKPAVPVDLANKVLAQFRNAPVRSDQWLRSLARTEHAETYWADTNKFFVCVFPDRSYVVYTFTVEDPERRVGAATLGPDDYEYLKGENGFKRVFG